MWVVDVETGSGPVHGDSGPVGHAGTRAVDLCSHQGLSDDAPWYSPSTLSRSSRLDRSTLLPDLAGLFPWTFWSFAREFSPFTARDGDWAATLSPDTVLPSIRPTATIQSVRPSLPEARAYRAPWSKGPSTTGGHAAASSDGHVSHNADRFASPRARRAVAALDVRSADTASPVPKYISSGVCPRNAECGSTRLCSST